MTEPESPWPDGVAGQRNEDDVQDDVRDELIKEFGSLIEESIIILLLREQGAEEARSALSALAQNVVEEEASGFDPSGFKGDVESPPSTRTGTLSPWPATSDYESTSQGTAMSGAPDDWQMASKEVSASDSTPEAVLRAAFPTLKDRDIQKALKDSSGDLSTAFDILLNIGHLEETGQRLTGVDAFFCPDGITYKKTKKKAAPKGNGSGGRRRRLSLDYKLAPPSLDDTADASKGSGHASASSTPPLRVSTSSSAAEGRSAVERAEIARQSWATASASFASASDAIRRGRSQPLFRQAAVVYAERGHEQVSAARQASSDAADALVDEQSTPNCLDLHSVPVHEGVRIALEGTQRWWAGLGEHRLKTAREAPLRVITGAGLHSARGFSRMYGEVGAALTREGWKVKPGQGHYLVTGKK